MLMHAGNYAINMIANLFEAAVGSREIRGRFAGPASNRYVHMNREFVGYLSSYRIAGLAGVAS